MAAIGRQALTVLLPVRTGREAALALAIDRVAPTLAERLDGGETLHFARLVLLPGALVDGEAKRASLLFETTYDGDVSAHVAELFALSGAELGDVLAECDGGSAGGGRSAFEATLRRGTRRAWAFSAANGGLGVKEIRRDAALRESVAELLERERATLRALEPLEILLSVRRGLGLGAPSPTSEAATTRLPEPEDPLLRLAGLVPLVAGMLLHDVRERVLGLWHDRRDAAPAWSPASGLATSTGRLPQRSFTHLSLAKPGRFRRGALRRALALVGSLLAEHGVERSAPGVHSLRFVMLDDGRLVFTNQQDGSLTSRLSALGRRARALLALVWSSTEGFPRALLGHLLGRTDDERVLAWLRACELPCAFSYSAYPTLTARDVAANAEVRALLAAEPTDARARRLLELV